jgi:uncharacterized protein
MDCPKCNGELEEKIVENVTVHVCWVCEGIWFDAGELDKVLDSDALDFENIDVGRKELEGTGLAKEMIDEFNKKIGKCPRCADGTAMDKVKSKNVLIDMCKKCHGVWLDGGEIQHLRHRALVNISDFLYSFWETLKWCCSAEGKIALRRRRW